MANLPPKIVLPTAPFSQSKTLFLPSPGKAGILVEQRGRRRAATPMQFTSSKAALAWCEHHRANLVYYFGPSPGRN
jgi:hypothetical protein